jgi:hypothetical protein
VAGSLLYIAGDKAVHVYVPTSGHEVATLPTGSVHWQSPIVADGRVYVLDAEVHLYVFDARSGAPLWDKALAPYAENTFVNSASFGLLGKNTSIDPSKGFGGGAAFDAGKLFVTTGFGTVFALDARSGRQIWKNDLGVPIVNAPVANGGRVFVSSQDNHFYALAEVDGRKLVVRGDGGFDRRARSAGGRAKVGKPGQADHEQRDGDQADPPPCPRGLDRGVVRGFGCFGSHRLGSAYDGLGTLTGFQCKPPSVVVAKPVPCSGLPPGRGATICAQACIASTTCGR